MNTMPKTTARTFHQGLELAERIDDLKDAWEVARDEGLLAYHDWCEAPPQHKGDCYFAYLAAADREAAAADHLRRERQAPRGDPRSLVEVVPSPQPVGAAQP